MLRIDEINSKVEDIMNRRQTQLLGIKSKSYEDKQTGMMKDKFRKQHIDERRKHDFDTIDNELSSTLRRLRPEIESAIEEARTEYFKQITGSDVLKDLAGKLGLDTQTANNLVSDLAKLRTVEELLTDSDPVSDLILRRKFATDEIDASKKFEIRKKLATKNSVGEKLARLNGNILRLESSLRDKEVMFYRDMFKAPDQA